MNGTPDRPWGTPPPVPEPPEVAEPPGAAGAAPSGTGRRRGRRARRSTISRRHRIAGAVLILGTLALGNQVNRFTPVASDGLAPRVEELQRAFVTSGRAGTVVEGEQFSVHVHGVRGAGRIEGDRLSGATSRTTAGVWLILDVTVTATKERTIVSHAALRDGEGRLFHQTGRMASPLLGGRILQPGVPVRGEAAFEVPLEAAGQGLTLVVAKVKGAQWWQPVVEITLPESSSADVGNWRQATSAPPRLLS